MKGTIVFLALILMTSTVFGAKMTDAQMQARLEQAMAQIEQLRAEVSQLKQQQSNQYQQDLQDAIKSLPAAESEASGSLVLPAGWSIQPYGYFKFDMSYDDAAVNGAGGDYVVSVKPENSTTRADDAFSFTARQTRLGLKVFAPNIGDLKVMGRVEMDFYNPVTAATNENKSTPQMRHAYGQIMGPDWSLLFGQTSDVISPLNLDTLNYTVGWFGGNIGYRHPQIRLTKWWDCPDKSQFKVETALSRNTGNDLDGGGVDDGQDASSPTILSRVSYAMPFVGEKKLTAGVSGHYGHEEIDWDHTGDDDEVHTWSVNGDLTVPVCDTVDVKGEVFWGENLDSYFGGIGQGVNTVSRDEIEAIGGWAQVAYKPCAQWAFNTGAGMDDPKNSDLNDGNKSLNYFVFTNVIHHFSKYLSTGIEFTYWRTDYKHSDDGDDFRVQHSWIVSF